MFKRTGLLIAVLIVFFSVKCFAAITLTDGYWYSSFDQEDWTHTTSPTTIDNGMVASNNRCANATFPCSKTTNTAPEQVLAAANNPDGVAGTAAQVHYFYTGADGNGSTNDMSSGLTIDFPSALTEFWFRWYVYYPSDSRNAGWKIIYFETDGSNPWMSQPYTSSFIGTYFADGNSGVVTSTSYPATWMTDNSNQGYGNWIPIEVHIKNDTDGTDGVYQQWRGNDLVIDRHDIDTGVGSWDAIHLGSNGSGITGPADTVVGIRFDDVAVATASYVGLIDDGFGNDRIGLLDAVADQSSHPLRTGTHIIRAGSTPLK